MIKVLVADFHPIIRTGLRMLFESSQDIQVIGSVTTGKELFDFVGKHDVDVVLSEIDLPELLATYYWKYLFLITKKNCDMKPFYNTIID